MLDNKKEKNKGKYNFKLNKNLLILIVLLVVSILFIFIYFLKDNKNDNSVIGTDDVLIEKELKKSIKNDDNTVFINLLESNINKNDNNEDNKSIEETYSVFISKESEDLEVVKIDKESGFVIENNSFNSNIVFNKEIYLKDSMTFENIDKFITIKLNNKNIEPNVDYHIHGNIFEILFENINESGIIDISIDFKGFIKSNDELLYDGEIVSYNYNYIASNNLSYKNYTLNKLEDSALLEVYFDNFISIKDSNSINLYVNDLLVNKSYVDSISNVLVFNIPSYKDGDEIILNINKDSLLFSNNYLKLSSDLNFVIE